MLEGEKKCKKLSFLFFFITIKIRFFFILLLKNKFKPCSLSVCLHEAYLIFVFLNLLLDKEASRKRDFDWKWIFLPTNTKLLLVLLLHPSTDDEDSGTFLPHRRKTLYDYILHQTIFILLALPCLVFPHLPSGWRLLGQSLLLHRMRQLIGQLLHRHLEKISRGD